METMQRRDFLRTSLFLAGGMTLSGILAACSNKSRSPADLANASRLQEIFDARAKEGGKQAVDIFLAGEDWVTGVENRLTFGLVRKGGGPDAPIKDLNATLWLAPSPDLSGKPSGPFTASWQGYSKPETGGPPGVHSADVTFDREGVWTALVEVRPAGSPPLLGIGAIQVKPKNKASTKLPGEKAIPSDTPTFSNKRGVDPICTRDPQCEFHSITLRQALAAGKPSLFIMATPKFCMSRTCGPNLNEVIAAGQELGDQVSIVHAEVYKDDKPDTISKFIASPTFKQWGFQSEPWLFVMDTAGTIVKRFEGPLAARGVVAAVRPLIG